MVNADYSPYFGDSTLKMNTDVYSTYVLNVQIWLNYLNAAGLDEDGRFGLKTQTAVEKFQRTHTGPDGKSLGVDGQVGKNTKWALWNAGGNKAVPGAVLD